MQSWLSTAAAAGSVNRYKCIYIDIYRYLHRYTDRYIYIDIYIYVYVRSTCFVHAACSLGSVQQQRPDVYKEYVYIYIYIYII